MARVYHDQKDLKEEPLLWRSDLLNFKEDEVYKHTNFEKTKDYFHIMGHDEVHTARRKEIIKAHPEIKALFGPDWVSSLIAVLTVLLMILGGALFKDLYWPWYILSAFLIGAPITHMSQVLIHEFIHFLCFESIVGNKLICIFVNISTAIPYSQTFGIYHIDHHIYLNSLKDPDLPSKWEISQFRSPIWKILFVLTLPGFYGIRPVICHPKVPTKWELINLVTIITSDYIISLYFGWYAVLWMAMSTYFGMGVHPCGAHVIAEHYEFIKNIETYDYFGIWNFFNLNLGYHIEHHDFPQVPWTRLPLVRKMAPEFYEKVPYHTSYVMTQLNYIFDGYIGPWSRISREKGKLSNVNGDKKNN